MTLAEEAVSAAEWRAAMGCFPSGVTVVTSWRGDRPVGSTVNAFCSVSLTPPLLLVCLDLANPILPDVEASGRFGVNILPASEGAALARRFAAAEEETRFEALAFLANEAGAPQLACAPTFIDCTVEAVHPGGDHRIVVGRGRRIDHAHEGAPLLYHRGGFPTALG